ncbi:MAG: hypothetical protein ACOC5C_01950 [Halobacteriota archaeon]
MSLCARCKGNLLCGRIKCPLLEKFKFLSTYSDISGELEKPTPPSVFVGRMGYPKVYIGPLMTLSDLEQPEYMDSPWMWSGKNIEDVISLRSSLLRGVKRVEVNSNDQSNDYYLVNLQEAAASTTHMDLETEVQKVIKRPVFDDVMQPMGMTGHIDSFKFLQNPKIPHKVEKIYYDDLNATSSVKQLFDSGFNTYYLQRIFSVGMMGEQSRRKLVPTRWSITAVHDILGEELKKEVQDFPSIDSCMLFRFQHFGNHFEVILTPGNYSFELAEIWMGESFWNPESTYVGYDREDIMKKKDYSTLSGGYYAARLPVLEYMKKKRRKASITVLREIRPEYYAPLGVWVVEEGARKAMNTTPEVFESYQGALESAAQYLRTPREKWLHHLGSGYQSSLAQFV